MKKNRPDNQKPQSKKTKFKIGWLFIVFAFFVFYYSMSRFNLESGFLAERLGSSFGYIIVLTIALRIIFFKTIFKSISIAILIGSLIFWKNCASEHIKNQKMILSNIVENYEQANTGKSISPSIKKVDKSDNIITKISFITQQCLIKQQNLSTKFYSEFEHLFELISANKLSNLEVLKTTKQKIEDFNNKIDSFNNERITLVNDCKNQVLELPISQKYKNSFLKGFDKNLARAKQTDERLIKLYKEMLIPTMNNLVTLMINSNEFISLENDQLIFERDEDLNNFNNYLAEIKYIAQEITLVETEVENRVSDSIERLKNRIK